MLAHIRSCLLTDRDVCSYVHALALLWCLDKVVSGALAQPDLPAEL